MGEWGGGYGGVCVCVGGNFHLISLVFNMPGWTRHAKGVARIGLGGERGPKGANVSKCILFYCHAGRGGGEVRATIKTRPIV